MMKHLEDPYEFEDSPGYEEWSLDGLQKGVDQMISLEHDPNDLSLLEAVFTSVHRHANDDTKRAALATFANETCQLLQKLDLAETALGNFFAEKLKMLQDTPRTSEA